MTYAPTVERRHTLCVCVSARCPIRRLDASSPRAPSTRLATVSKSGLRRAIYQTPRQPTPEKRRVGLQKPAAIKLPTQHLQRNLQHQVIDGTQQFFRQLWLQLVPCQRPKGRCCSWSRRTVAEATLGASRGHGRHGLLLTQLLLKAVHCWVRTIVAVCQGLLKQVLVQVAVHCKGLGTTAVHLQGLPTQLLV